MSTEEVREYEPFGVLRTLLDEGFRLAIHITPEYERLCQCILNDSAELFFEQSQEDVQALERLIGATSAEQAGEGFFLQVRNHAYNLLGQAQLLGFTLIADIAGHMISCITHEQLPLDVKYQLVRRITDTLKLAFHQKIQDAGGPRGKELLAVVEGYLATSH